ncbi:hypothetical protein SASPL_135309 [Salvia splendens]|uniref:GYF domain-containing protein n=1 Tax=Salvia splendens TaxID=180675 RepID=A0A8X8ZFC3_SALSN|nr:hypothetical protein SASPL_135309 [Salvia splendens]
MNARGGILVKPCEIVSVFRDKEKKPFLFSSLKKNGAAELAAPHPNTVAAVARPAQGRRLLLYFLATHCEKFRNINAELSFVQLELRACRNQYDGHVYYGVVNNVEDDQSKLGTKYTVPQIAFYRGIGISSGFLPGELPVYPIVNGSLLNAVPLSYFNQFPDHVATGFVYLNVKESTNDAHGSIPNNSDADKRFPLTGDDESSWLFEDGEGKRQGPHSLNELYSWRQYGYMRDSVMVYHTENKFKPLNLATLLNTWRKARIRAVTTYDDNGEGTGLALKLVSEISDEVCSQLHSGIMKTARKVLLDEIMEDEWRPENPAEKDHAIWDEVEVEHTVDSEICYGGDTMKPPPSMKSIGSFENFCAAHTVVSRTLFYSCLEVMWNAICYDPVADYTSSWRRKRRWYDPGYVARQRFHKEFSQPIEKLPADSLVHKQDSSSSEVDCPPGFGPERISTDIEAKSPSVSQHSEREESSNKILSSHNTSYDEMGAILEYAMNDLHSSSKLSLEHHFERLVDEEVKKVAFCSSPTWSDDHLGLAQSKKHPLHQTVALSHEVIMENVPKVAFQKLLIHSDDPTNIEVDELCPCLSEEDRVINGPLDISRVQFQNLPGSADCMDIEISYGAGRFSDATLLTGKYVYSRRSKLGCKKLEPFFKALIKGEDRHPKLAPKKSKKSRTHKKVVQPAQVDTIVPNLEKKASKPDTAVPHLEKKGSKPDTTASVRRVKASARHICRQAPDIVISLLQGKKTENPSLSTKDHYNLEQITSASTVPKSNKLSKLKRKSLNNHSQHSRPGKFQKLANGTQKEAMPKQVDGHQTKRIKTRTPRPCPQSDGCARGWEWREWASEASPAERARVTGNHIRSLYISSECNGNHSSSVKGLSARTNRATLRNLLAAAEGADLLKATQLKARKKRLRFQRSKIHDWGLVALEPIEAEDFVIEYVGELIRRSISDTRERQYEKMGIGSSYLFRLDDGYVVEIVDVLELCHPVTMSLSLDVLISYM